MQKIRFDSDENENNKRSPEQEDQSLAVCTRYYAIRIPRPALLCEESLADHSLLGVGVGIDCGRGCYDHRVRSDALPTVRQHLDDGCTRSPVADRQNPETYSILSLLRSRS